MSSKGNGVKGDASENAKASEKTTKKVKVNALLRGSWGAFDEGVHEMDAALADRLIKEKLAVEVKEGD